MDRILIIGCPGSGKSTLSKKLAKILDYPILHLDRIWHIDNYNQISREEMILKIKDFIAHNDKFIIDGNYSGTMKLRMESADTVLFFNMDTETCLRNVLSRISENKPRDDIAPGFDNSILHPEFIEYVKSFREDKLPYIVSLVNDFPGKLITFNNYSDVDNFLKSLVK